MIEKFTIATVAEQSQDFRKVLWTGSNTQLVIMTIPAGGEIGEETHPDTDQILTFVSGIGEAVVAGEAQQVTQGDLVVVPAGTKHNFRNTGENPLILYTVYGPPEHADGAVHTTKEEADEAEESGQDEPPTQGTPQWLLPAGVVGRASRGALDRRPDGLPPTRGPTGG